MASPRKPRRAVLPGGIRRADRHAGRRLYRSRTPSVVDSGFGWISSAAENGFFWAVVTGAVALSGQRGRRAALRGVLTLGTASLSANLVAKRTIRARRPIARGIRHGVRNIRTPNSAAFPSGHGATAAALATGVGAESVVLGSVLGVLAMLISYSRLHVGAHELSDVLAGNAYGGAVGLLGYLLIRPRGD